MVRLLLRAHLGADVARGSMISSCVATAAVAAATADAGAAVLAWAGRANVGAALTASEGIGFGQQPTHGTLSHMKACALAMQAGAHRGAFIAVGACAVET